MLILGIDPGTATTGYGLIEMTDKDFKVVEWGLIETTKDNSAEVRLVKIHEDLNTLIKRVKPDVFAIEKVFFATNAKTAIAVGQAIGVMMLSASYAGLSVCEYAPGTIKKAIAGDGRADKKKMQQAVRQHLGAKVRSAAHKRTHFDNAADGLAVALCHILSTRSQNV